MDTAQKILVVYGTLSLGYGFVLGIPISQSRMRSLEASRHLVIAHLSAIIPGRFTSAFLLPWAFRNSRPG